jgi:hypothetical protein
MAVPFARVCHSKFYDAVGAQLVTNITYSASRTRHFLIIRDKWRFLHLPPATWIKTMIRAMIAVGLVLAVCQGAAAADEPSHNLSCAQVRSYVEQYTLPVAENYARSHGATEAEIAKARRCLRSHVQRKA